MLSAAFILIKVAGAMFIMDIFAALVMVCIAAGRETWAANFDTVGDVTGKYLMPIVAVAADHAGVGFTGAIAAGVGGWLGTKIGVRLGKRFAAYLGKPVAHHRFPWMSR